MTLNFFTNIISTTFSLKLKTEKNVKEIAEFIIQIRGYKKEKELEDSVTFKTLLLQHIWFHPNFLVSKSTLKITRVDECQLIKFKVFHLIPIIIYILFCLFFYYNNEFQNILIIQFALLAYLVYNNLNQRVILKEIEKEVGK